MKKRRQQQSATRVAAKTLKQPATPPTAPSKAPRSTDAGEAAAAAPAPEFAKRRVRVIMGYDRTP